MSVDAIGASSESKRIHKRPKIHQQPDLNPIRIRDLHRLFRRRYCGEFYIFPDDDAGREDLAILASFYIHDRHLIRNIKVRAPWLIGDDLDDFLSSIVHPIEWTSAKLADALNLHEAERVELGIVSIGAVDVTPEQRKAKRKARNRERKRETRRAKGAKPQARSKSRLKPWNSEGISRATWYRRVRQDGETTSSATIRIHNRADKPVSRTSLRPWTADGVSRATWYRQQRRQSQTTPRQSRSSSRVGTRPVSTSTPKRQRAHRRAA
jgi:hypothetical protein